MINTSSLILSEAKNASNYLDHPRIRGENNQPIAKEHGYAIQEIVECREDFAVYRNYECADCYGLPNIGMKICVYEAGTAAGCLGLPLGKRVEVTEVKCCANGDPYCEFEVRVME